MFTISRKTDVNFFWSISALNPALNECFCPPSESSNQIEKPCFAQIEPESSYIRLEVIYMKHILTTLLVLSSLGLANAQKNKSTVELDKQLEELLKVSKAPGFAVAVVKGDQVIYSKGFGYSNLEKKEKVDENTLFAIGSTTKAFTTGLLGIMEDEKELSFEDSPIKYLPELRFSNDLLNNEITIEDLVCHRSGLPRHDFSWYLFPTPNKHELLARVQYQEPFADIRTQWYYNNFGYLIQGMITEELTGKTWEQNIEERYFKPLGMARSTVTLKDWLAQTNVATGYELRNLKTSEPVNYFNISAMSPAGSINSSVKDMTAWLQVWLNDGKYKDQQILPLAYIAKAMNPLMLMGTGIADPKFPDQHLKSYGYAWFTSSYKGHYRMEHGGNIDGFSANVCLMPADDYGVVVLTNQDGSLVPALARDIVVDYFMSLPKTDWIDYHNERMKVYEKMVKDQADVAENNRQKNTRPSHEFEDYEGNYHHPGYGTFTVTTSNDSLYAQFTERRYFLEHWHYDTYKPFEVKNGKVDTLAGLGNDLVFYMDWSGQIVKAEIKLEPTLDAISFKRTALVKAENLELYKSYAGDYQLQGITLKVKDKGNGQLTLDVPGQPQYTLSAASETEFVLEGLTGYKAQFLKGKEGQWELHMIQPNGTFIAKKAQ